MITKPKLPPKMGYVERVNANGEHYYAPTAETQAKLAAQAERTQARAVSNALLGGSGDDLQAAEQFRKALQMFAASLTDEQAMEVATIYDPWGEGKTYAVGDFITYGENSVGDPQLYEA